MEILCHLKELVAKTKIEVLTVMREHQEISKKFVEVLLLKERINLLQATCESQRHILSRSTEELVTATDNNNRKEEKLKRAQSRDFNKKFLQAQSDCTRKEHALQKDKEELVLLRKSFITHLIKRVFPISLNTINSEGVQQRKQSIDPLCDYEVIDNNLLSTAKEDTDQSLSFDYIGYGCLPSDGNLTEYTRLVKLKKAISTTTNSEDPNPIDFNDLTLSIPVALSLIAHLLWIIANVLDQSLPYSLILPVVLCEYGRSDRKAHTVLQFLAKLDDNIMFLCFTQNVSPELLTTGHTLKNLSVLVGHYELGRSGPFTCHPELLHYQLVCKKRDFSSSEANWEDEPPLLHTAQEDIDRTLQEAESDDSDTEIDKMATVGEGWEEVHDLMVPTHLFSGPYGDRLEYGTSYSEYGQRTVLIESEQQEMHSSESVNSSSGLLDTLSSLLGSAWTKK